MPSTPTRLRLEGYTDLTVVSQAFVSEMVDVAEIDEITDDAIYVIPDTGGAINLGDPEDVEWLTDVILGVLKDHGQGVRITLV